MIAGASHGVNGTVQREVTEPLYLDIHLPAGATFELALPAGITPSSTPTVAKRPSASVLCLNVRRRFCPRSPALIA